MPVQTIPALSVECEAVSGFASPELVAAAVGLFDRHQVDQTTGQFLVGEHGVTPEGPSFFLSVSPGTVQLRAVDLAKSERRAVAGSFLPASADGLPEGQLHDHVYGSAQRLVDGWEHDRWLGDVGPHVQGTRSSIEEWSRKSRRNMVRVLGAVDWRPLFQGGTPGLLTLTYADGWQDVAPDGEAVKRHLRMLGKRWLRRFGVPMVGVWKMEFQSRGAPHFHLLINVPPVGPRKVEAFVRKAWAEIVDHPDALDRMFHEVRGAKLDMREGARMRDVRRVASYFVKHSLKGSGSKEYQHRVPDLWVESGAGPGRFWGLWGLETSTAGVQLPVGSFVGLRRLLRRYGRSRGLRLCTTGRLSGGWVVVRDGPAFAAQLSRALSLSAPAT